MEILDEDLFERALIKMVRETVEGSIVWKPVVTSVAGDSAWEADVANRRLRVRRNLAAEDEYQLHLMDSDVPVFTFPDHVAVEDLFDAASAQDVGVNEFLDSYLAETRPNKTK